MNLSILLTVTLFSLSALAGVLKPVKLDKKVELILAKCQKAVKAIDEEIPDTIACPKSQAYGYNEELNVEALKKTMDKELSYSLKISKSTDWLSLFEDSFAYHLGWVTETLSEGSGQYSVAEEKKIRKGMRDADAAFSQLIEFMKASVAQSGARVFLDTETFWAPRVNGKAFVIMNSKKKSVEVYLHGDLDG
jgi:hypothetical protein